MVHILLVEGILRTVVEEAASRSSLRFREGRRRRGLRLLDRRHSVLVGGSRVVGRQAVSGEFVIYALADLKRLGCRTNAIVAASGYANRWRRLRGRRSVAWVLQKDLGFALVRW